MTFIIICLDGFKKEYLDKTQFLKSLLSKSISGDVYHGFGYASEFSAITGKDIEELGIIVNNFYYHPREFTFFSSLRFLDFFPFKKKIRILLDLFYNSKEFLVGNNQPKSTFQIPLNYFKYFDFLFKKNFFTKNSLVSPTIFEKLVKKNVSGYMWPFIYENNKTKIDLLNLSINTANTDERAFNKSIKLLKKNPDIFYVHFFSTDNLVHKLGTKSPKTSELIVKLDYYVSELSKFADKILIYSDHGMTDITETINIKDLVNNSGLIYGKDYIMFLDATLARFWFFNDNAKQKIKKLLLKTQKGKFVFFKNLEIHKKFGDLIFQVNPGILILPNFYQNLSDKATHGYTDDFKDEKAFYLFYNLNNPKKLNKDIQMKEIYNIILNNS